MFYPSLRLALAAPLLCWFAAPAAAATVPARYIVADTKEFTILLPAAWEVKQAIERKGPMGRTLVVMAQGDATNGPELGCLITSTPVPGGTPIDFGALQRGMSRSGVSGEVRPVTIGALPGLRLVVGASANAGMLPLDGLRKLPVQRERGRMRFLSYMLAANSRLYSIGFFAPAAQFEQRTCMFDAIARSFNLIWQES